MSHRASNRKQLRELSASELNRVTAGDFLSIFDAAEAVTYAVGGVLTGVQSAAELFLRSVTEVQSGRNYVGMV